ncbi:hypothetical protein EMCRGX_G021718 [Ephydatia muelleri]
MRLLLFLLLHLSHAIVSWAQPPTFTSPSYSVQVQETTAMTVVGVAQSPRPPDGFLTVRCINGFNSSVGMTYTIGQVNGSFPFVLDSTTGSFSVTQDLVYATQPHSYNFSVWCYDNLSPNLSSNASVTISVIEVDKYKPVITPSYLFLTLNETTPVGTVLASTRRDVGALSVYNATDMDVGPQGALYYNLYYSDPRFSADGTFGTLTVQQSLSVDYIGATTFINIIITACDPHVCSSDFNIYITILRQNDYYPMFSQKVYSVTYNNGTPPGQVIPSICTDQDIGVGALQGVVFLNTTPGVFSLNPSTGALTTSIRMDYRRARGYTVVLLCRDTGGLTITSTVYVTITPPPNYNPLAFSSDSYVFNVSRTTPPLYIIGQIMATNEIIWITTLTYSLQSNPYFIIDSLNGTIQTISSVFDYPYPEIILNATVTDGLFNDTVAVHMVLTPGNLNSPVFTPGNRSFDINELSPIGTSVATFQCTDADNGANGQISYSITGASYPYQLTIQCSDHGVPIKSNVTLAYFNVYQALPNFTSGIIDGYVNENANINDTVITINVSDQFPLKYSFIDESVPNAFTIDANTGVVRVAAHLDHDTVPLYTMTVVAIRSAGPARNSSALLTIYVRDVNSHAPQCSPSTLNTTVIPRDLPLNGLVLQMNCSDRDRSLNGQIVYSLSDGGLGVLGINTSGAIYLVGSLNAINLTDLAITVLLSDKGSPPQHNSYAVTVHIVEECTLSFVNLPTSLILNESTSVGSEFFTAMVVNGSCAGVQYSIGPNAHPFQISNISGAVSLIQTLNYNNQGRYNITIMAAAGGKTVIGVLTVSVAPSSILHPTTTVAPSNTPSEQSTYSGISVATNTLSLVSVASQSSTQSAPVQSTATNTLSLVSAASQSSTQSTPVQSISPKSSAATNSTSQMTTIIIVVTVMVISLLFIAILILLVCLSLFYCHMKRTWKKYTFKSRDNPKPELQKGLMTRESIHLDFNPEDPEADYLYGPYDNSYEETELKSPTTSICIADIEPTVMVSTSEVSEREEKGHPEEEQHPRGDPVMGPILKTLVAEWKQGDAMLSKQGP